MQGKMAKSAVKVNAVLRFFLDGSSARILRRLSAESP